MSKKSYSLKKILVKEETNKYLDVENEETKKNDELKKLVEEQKKQVEEQQKKEKIYFI